MTHEHCPIPYPLCAELREASRQKALEFEGRALELEAQLTDDLTAIERQMINRQVSKAHSFAEMWRKDHQRYSEWMDLPQPEPEQEAA